MTPPVGSPSQVPPSPRPLGVWSFLRSRKQGARPSPCPAPRTPPPTTSSRLFGVPWWVEADLRDQEALSARRPGLVVISHFRGHGGVGSVVCDPPTSGRPRLRPCPGRPGSMGHIPMPTAGSGETDRTGGETDRTSGQPPGPRPASAGQRARPGEEEGRKAPSRSAWPPRVHSRSLGLSPPLCPGLGSRGGRGPQRPGGTPQCPSPCAHQRQPLHPLP